MNLEYQTTRLQFYTGKGGVGKTLVSAAVALQLANQGKRTLWVELTDVAKGNLLFTGYQPTYDMQEVNPHLWAMQLQFRPAIEEYLHIVFRIAWFSRKVARNKLFQVFTDALPGLYALVTMGKIWYEAERQHQGRPYWDHLIIDAPATGHGLSLFRFTQAVLDVVSSGPVADRTRDMHEMLADRQHTSIHVVSLLDALVVDETCELVKLLESETPYRASRLIANSVMPTLGATDPKRVAAWLQGSSEPELEHVLGAMADAWRTRLNWYQDRYTMQQQALGELNTLNLPVHRLPWLPDQDDRHILRSLVHERHLLQGYP